MVPGDGRNAAREELDLKPEERDQRHPEAIRDGFVSKSKPDEFRFGGQSLATEKPNFGGVISNRPTQMQASQTVWKETSRNNNRLPRQPRPKWDTPEGYREIFGNTLDDFTEHDFFMTGVERYFDIGEIRSFNSDIPRWKVWNRAMHATMRQIREEESDTARVAYSDEISEDCEGDWMKPNQSAPLLSQDTQKSSGGMYPMTKDHDRMNLKR
jgi:hypothetical protein